jgi:DNA-binding transcriptional LysR family regulator
MDAQRNPRLSLDLLRGFRAAARHLSFTRAAQELFLTQPAISRGIRTLEEQLGKPLFDRVNRTLRLTAEGEQLFRAVDEAIESIDGAARRIAGPGRALAVTTTVPLASMWLGPRLPRFARAHPEIDMRLVASNDVLDLVRERVDVAIRHLPQGASEPVDGERLLDYEISRSAHRSWLAIAGVPCARPVIWRGTSCSTCRRPPTVGPGTTGSTGSTP